MAVFYDFFNEKKSTKNFQPQTMAMTVYYKELQV